MEPPAVGDEGVRSTVRFIWAVPGWTGAGSGGGPGSARVSAL